ncbi:MAG: tRNA (N(6)-L-threonylcarbamoyladenosine(37)-C(2))-methylthiotransferase MtaB [Prevotellaceae bacterium]|jgi:threonylcarbamoyladenosine tRNA methylthiotransferase MtaB|nr:tRNA (N(6)-L-threonylcarbamoyladenosine(37)-C(2))-methylthiotransferase MtaB [Prevotellaceae bacterium]
MAVKQKIAFVTLGCKLNFSETSTIARQFPEPDYERVPPTEQADVYVVNTCSVTSAAERKCRQAIRRAAKLNPDAAIVVTGCYAQLRPHEIAALHQDASKITVVADKNEIYAPHAPRTAAPSENFFAAYSSGDRTRSFLKVQDGCDYRCTYCTIPLARGKSRNIPIGKLVDTAEAIARKGVKEIVITGVNIGDFGKSTGDTFFDLLKALHGVEGIERYRISSIEPNLLTHDMIRWIADARKILPHFHIPLQSGSNKILAAMQRRYTRELFAQRVGEIRHAMPYAFIGADVITGFPDETAADFDDTFRFLRQLAPSFVHVFPYSPRPHTPAAAYGNQVAEQERMRRSEALTQLSHSLLHDFYKKNIGRDEYVLFEHTEKNGCMYGYTRNYIKVETSYDAALTGQIAAVRLSDMLRVKGDVLSVMCEELRVKSDV